MLELKALNLQGNQVAPHDSLTPSIEALLRAAASTTELVERSRMIDLAAELNRQAREAQPERAIVDAALAPSVSLDDPLGRKNRGGWLGDWRFGDEAKGDRSQRSSGRSGGALRKSSQPTRAESVDPNRTPSFVASWSSGASKANKPMNRLMVKPTPHRTATP